MTTRDSGRSTQACQDYRMEPRGGKKNRGALATSVGQPCIRLVPLRSGITRFALIAAGMFAVCGVALRTGTVSAQTLGMTPPPTVIDDCGKVRGICCSGPLVWGFDPFGGCQQCDGLNGHSCRSGFTAHRPATWYGGVDIVALTPNASEEVVLARLETNGPNALSTADLRSEYDAGSRLVVGRTFRGCFQLEAVYQGNYAWSDERIASSSADNISTILDNFSTATRSTATAETASRMTTAEVNFRTWLEMPPGALDVQFIVGARYLSASDRLVLVNTPTGAAANTAIASTDNDLYGAQLGIDTRLLLHRLFYIDFEGKVALCDNFATVAQVADSTNQANDATHRSALLGDLMLTGNMQFRPNLTLRFGYQAIFVDGLALAGSNIPSDSTLGGVGLGQFRNDGVMVYHGPTLGLIGTW